MVFFAIDASAAFGHERCAHRVSALVALGPDCSGYEGDLFGTLQKIDAAQGLQGHTTGTRQQHNALAWINCSYSISISISISITGSACAHSRAWRCCVRQQLGRTQAMQIGCLARYQAKDLAALGRAMYSFYPQGTGCRTRSVVEWCQQGPPFRRLRQTGGLLSHATIRHVAV